jgi:hypothetical protein
MGNCGEKPGCAGGESRGLGNTATALAGRLMYKNVNVMNSNSDPKAIGNPKRIVVQYGLCEAAVWLRFPQTLGRLLSSPHLIAILGYPLHNVTAIMNGAICDFETLVGSQDARISLRITANRKAAGMPKARKWKAFAVANGFTYVGPGPGDHEVWAYGKQKIQINRNGNELDFASVKAVTKILNSSLPETIKAIQQGRIIRPRVHSLNE